MFELSSHASQLASFAHFMAQPEAVIFLLTCKVSGRRKEEVVRGKREEEVYYS